jgi:hypothetical protein
MSIADVDTTSSAGWYPDPAHSTYLRYWDGDSWTSKLESAGPATEPQYTYAPDGTAVRVHQYV